MSSCRLSNSTRNCIWKLEDKGLLAAVNHTKHDIAAASAHHKRLGSLAGRLAGYINPSISTGGTEWIAGMAPWNASLQLCRICTYLQRNICFITNPAFLVTRHMEDFVTSDPSELKRIIMNYNDDLDQKNRKGFPARLLGTLKHELAYSPSPSSCAGESGR
ncbi:hypothetical protein DFJ58DRAFT_733937 [Suillus subalutaceus]|uniref:uncharacterized protein n=1 Tax=Suillus subalutaceus TaxID=48586 RepID=UPI001B861D79|nr:uncharacterized protein DFJ58DRAFT_733937 [Suillus subalutaceus]KAG1838196.1 hypothetical protein DFJ58DRAFT_733937 [Suillus subalutaceus]